jgi:hypothetical protein
MQTVLVMLRAGIDIMGRVSLPTLQGQMHGSPSFNKKMASQAPDALPQTQKLGSPNKKPAAHSLDALPQTQKHKPSAHTVDALPQTLKFGSPNKKPLAHTLDAHPQTQKN